MNKGITLVALIMTIIIMLILASIAISLITGEGNIFNKADLIKSKYEEASQKEKNTIDDLSNQINNGGNTSIVIPGASTIEFIYTPSIVWTNQPVKVDITTVEIGFIIQYSLDNGTTWKDYENSLIITKNKTTILARLEKDGLVGNVATGTIYNIDTNIPTNSNIEAGTPSTNSCVLTLKGKDNEETEDSGTSGISKYELYVDNELNTTINSTNSLETITLPLLKSSHDCYVKVYDAAGNYKQSNTITVVKHVHEDSCYEMISGSGVFHHSGVKAGLYTYTCSACGYIESWPIPFGAREGMPHEGCTAKVRGNLICGL